MGIETGKTGLSFLFCALFPFLLIICRHSAKKGGRCSNFALCCRIPHRFLFESCMLHAHFVFSSRLFASDVMCWLSKQTVSFSVFRHSHFVLSPVLSIAFSTRTIAFSPCICLFVIICFYFKITELKHLFTLLELFKIRFGFSHHQCFLKYLIFLYTSIIQKNVIKCICQ